MLWIMLGIIALNIAAVALLMANRRRRIARAHGTALPIWRAAAAELGLELLPPTRASDVIGLTGTLDGLRVTAWGLHVSSRGIVMRERGFWTHIVVETPGLPVGFRPSAPRTLWFRREGGLLDIATPGYAAHVGHIPPESDAIEPPGAPASLAVFGDAAWAAALIEADAQRITRLVVGRSLYIHDGEAQLNHTNLPEDAAQLARDIRELVDFVCWLRAR